MTSFDTYHCLSPLLTFDLEKGYIKGEKRTQKQQNNDTRKLLFKQCTDLPSIDRIETMVNELSIASLYKRYFGYVD